MSETCSRGKHTSVTLTEQRGMYNHVHRALLRNRKKRRDKVKNSNDKINKYIKYVHKYIIIIIVLT